MHLSHAFSALLLAPLTIATHLRLSIPSTSILPHPNTLPPSTHATLTTLTHTYTARYRTDDTFSFPNITSGSYLLDVHCHTYAFAPLRVDVRQGLRTKEDRSGVIEVEEVHVWGTFRGNEWGNKGEEMEVTKTHKKKKDVFEVAAKVLGPKEYFIERPGFSPLGLLKNPMIMIAGASMLLVFGMPYLMDNMDPELKAEFEERQKTASFTSTNAANPLQNFDAAAWLAGSSGSSNKKNEPAAPVERGVTR